MSGKGTFFIDQLFDAVEKACKDDRFSGPLTRADLEIVTVEVWIQIASTEIPHAERQSAAALKLGEDGVEVKYASKSAYFKPSVALTSAYLTPAALFDAVCKKAGIEINAWHTVDCSLFRTEWLHFAESTRGDVHQLRALRPIQPTLLDRESVNAWIFSGADYLSGAELCAGEFCYKYDPLADVAAREKTNPVRASGCAYALSAVAGLPDGRGTPYLQAATRACERIAAKCVLQAQDCAYIGDSPTQEESGGKLGSTALLLLALMHLPSQSPLLQRMSTSLMNGIKSAQQESGSFRCCFGDLKESASQSNFFPGQALLALAFASDKGIETSSDIFERAFIHYREHFRATPTTAFVGWHVDVWSRVYRLHENQEHAEFAFEQLDWLLQWQIRDHNQGIYDGGFLRDGNPPNSSSFVFTEALARGAALAYDLGDHRWGQYRHAFQKGFAFCSRLRLTDSQSAFFVRPDRAIGGSVRSITNFQIRSDVVQHAITLGLSILDCHALLK
jgi:hypothetical protein